MPKSLTAKQWTCFHIRIYIWTHINVVAYNGTLPEFCVRHRAQSITAGLVFRISDPIDGSNSTHHTLPRIMWSCQGQNRHYTIRGLPVRVLCRQPSFHTRRCYRLFLFSISVANIQQSHKPHQNTWEEAYQFVSATLNVESWLSISFDIYSTDKWHCLVTDTVSNTSL